MAPAPGPSVEVPISKKPGSPGPKLTPSPKLIAPSPKAPVVEQPTAPPVPKKTLPAPTPSPGGSTQPEPSPPPPKIIPAPAPSPQSPPVVVPVAPAVVPSPPPPSPVTSVPPAEGPKSPPTPTAPAPTVPAPLPPSIAAPPPSSPPAPEASPPATSPTPGLPSPAPPVGDTPSPAPPVGDTPAPVSAVSPPPTTPSPPIFSSPPPGLGPPLTPPTPTIFGFPSPPPPVLSNNGGLNNNKSSSGLSGTVVIGIAAGGGVLLALVILACFFLLCLRKKKRQETYIPAARNQEEKEFGVGSARSQYSNKPPGPPHFSGASSGGDTSVPGVPLSTVGSVGGNSRSFFTYGELESATNNFSPKNLLGEGGFGRVYKGVLENGQVVAVKQLTLGGGQGEREFRAEIEVISRVHHKHLVSLVGFCVADQQRLLVYEFVPNGTLEAALHDRKYPVLNWPTRLKIAVGAARGLAYLHEDSKPRIIHRDIKASNILLDEDMDAQVADFGLAKILNKGPNGGGAAVTHVTTRVMGTFGYLAPEYAMSGKLTDKSDVFSFGVVLLELISGRKPVDTSMPAGQESLVEWARPLLNRDDVNSIADPELDGQYDLREMERMMLAAALCVRQTADKRPKMSQVVRMLEDDTIDQLLLSKPGQTMRFDEIPFGGNGGVFSEDMSQGGYGGGWNDNASVHSYDDDYRSEGTRSAEHEQPSRFASGGSMGGAGSPAARRFQNQNSGGYASSTGGSSGRSPYAPPSAYGTSVRRPSPGHPGGRPPQSPVPGGNSPAWNIMGGGGGRQTASSSEYDSTENPLPPPRPPNMDSAEINRYNSPSWRGSNNYSEENNSTIRSMRPPQAGR